MYPKDSRNDSDGVSAEPATRLHTPTTSFGMSRAVQSAVPTIPYRQIRARQPTPDSIIVYQAYSAEIANAAVAQQRLDASPAFKMPRMSWIKPSFYWCKFIFTISAPVLTRSGSKGMYRAGWSYKDPYQAHILQITVSKEGFLKLLEQASPSSGPDMAKGAAVRYQWDPERDIRLGKLSYRSLQLGLAGEVKEKWIREWIIRIDDITEDVRRWKGYIDEGSEDDVARAQAEIESRGKEKVFEVSEELQQILRMGVASDADHGGHGQA